MMLKDATFQTPKTIGAWIVNYVDRDAGASITHLKLQKLLYYVEAWFLANFDRQLFAENVQAWTHGPVYRSVYDKYNGSNWDALPKERSVSLGAKLEPFVKAVYGEYGQFSAKKLEDLTHLEDPWKLARYNLPPEARCEDAIDKLIIRNYYAARLGKKTISKLSN